MRSKPADTLEVALAATSPTEGMVPYLGSVVLPAAPTGPSAAFGAVVGHLTGFNKAGEPLVLWPGAPDSVAVVARSILPLEGLHVSQEMLLVFDGGDPGKPVITGVIQPCSVPGNATAGLAGDGAERREVSLDGQRIVLSAREEIVLRCGKASITLTRAGKVLIRGAYLLSRSSGVNRIKGGSVQIN